MKNLSIIIIILAFHIHSFAQKDLLSAIPNTGKQINDFIPKGYKILFQTKGDLNDDGQQDVALIIYSEKMIEDTTWVTDSKGYNKTIVREMISSTRPTILIILLKQEDHYNVQSKTLNTISYGSINEMLMDEYHTGARIKPLSIYKEGLSIYTYFRDNGWATIFKAKFRYINKDLFLIHTTNNYYHEVERCNKIKKFPGDYIDRNYITYLETYKTILQNDCKLTIKRSALKEQPLIRLNDFNINIYKENFNN